MGEIPGLILPRTGIIFAAPRRGTARTLRLFTAPHIKPRGAYRGVFFPVCCGCGQVVPCSAGWAIPVNYSLALDTLLLALASSPFSYLIAVSGKLLLFQPHPLLFCSFNSPLHPATRQGSKWAVSCLRCSSRNIKLGYHTQTMTRF